MTRPPPSSLRAEAPTRRLAYTLPELAGLVPCSVKLLRAEIGRGRLRASRLGRLLRVRVEDAEAWLRESVVGNLGVDL